MIKIGTEILLNILCGTCEMRNIDTTPITTAITCFLNIRYGSYPPLIGDIPKINRSPIAHSENIEKTNKADLI